MTSPALSLFSCFLLADTHPSTNASTDTPDGDDTGRLSVFVLVLVLVLDLDLDLDLDLALDLDFDLELDLALDLDLVLVFGLVADAGDK